MKILLVPWMLLLLGPSLNSGHYIRNTEHGKPNVYHVRESSAGVTFENPKPDKMTLREILYYHIIERPREEPDIPARSFTNSHGYPFLQEPLSKEHDENESSEHDENDSKHMEESREYIGRDEDTDIHEEDPETTTEAKPLTDKDVKEAYKSRSYLFDQMRQRYAVKRMAVPDSLKRRRRQAEIQLPDAPSFSNKDAYVLPKTYGMNLNPEGGYVWNNLNKPPSYYELEPSYGNSNEGQYGSAQSQENLPPPSENMPPSQTSDAGSLEDIYVNTNRPSAIPTETEPEKTNPEIFNDNAEPINENPQNDSGLKSLDPIRGNYESKSNEDFANNPIGPEAYQNPIREEPAETVGDSNMNPQDPVFSLDSTMPDGQPQPAESIENPGYGNGRSELEEPKPESSPEVSSEGEKIKEIPVAPTLPPLNYDILPDYVRDAISSTEKPGQYESAQSQEIKPPPSENIPPSETSDSGSLEDIYVNTNRPSALPIETEPEKINPEIFNDNAELINENPQNDSGLKSVDPIRGNDESKSNEDFANNPIGPEAYQNPIREEPAETVGDSNVNPQDPVFSLDSTMPDGQPQPAESIENPGYGNGRSELEEPKPESSPEESSEREKIKEIPVAPTLPPLNYDILPDFIRDAISSTEKPTSYEQTDNPYINPQPSPDDKKILEDKMEDIFATVQPVEDIPKTYGMNLTSDGGHVWNDLVNPPVSYDVGSPSNPGEEKIEEQPQAPTEQPEIQESENPIPKLAEPENDQPTINPEEPNQKPDTYETEEKPIEEPIVPELKNEGEPEKPIADPNQGLLIPEPNQEPDTHESEQNPIEEPIAPEPVNEGEPEEPIFDPSHELPEPSEPNQDPDTEQPIEEPIAPEPENEGKPEEPIADPNQRHPEPEPNQEPDIHESDEAKPIEQPVLPELESEGKLEEPIADPNQALPEPVPDQEPNIPDSEEKPIEEPIAPEPVNEGEPEEPIAHPNQGLPEPEPNQEPDTHGSDEAKPIEQPILPELKNEGEPEEPIADPIQGLPEPVTDQGPNIPDSEEKLIEEPIAPEPENDSKPQEHIADPNQDIPTDTETEPQIPDNEKNPIEEPSQPELVEPKPSVQPENPVLIPEPEDENNHEIEIQEQPETGEPTDHIEEPENEAGEETTDEENNKPDIMSELLKSEQFWKWLGEWTATYMELLEKHMRKIAIQEICKREKAGVQMCPLEDNPEDTGVIIKDGKIIVDGREIEVTHTDNLDNQLKGHHNNKHENKGTSGNKVEASTIYGNSVGNDKVTNVFIFTADKAEEVIDQLKPVNNSEIDFVIDDRIKEENKDEPNNEKSIEDEINVDVSNIDDINKESNEGAIDTEDTNKDESIKEEVSNGGNIESSESVTNEESNVSQANTELNNEASITESIDDISKEESIKNEENTDLKPELDAEDLNKDEELAEVNKNSEKEEPEGPSGDMGEIDDEANDDKPKLDSSEIDITNSKEYLEKK